MTTLQLSVSDLQKDTNSLTLGVSKSTRVVESTYRLRILDWISPIRYESAHNNPKRKALAQTADWLMQHEDYVAWNQVPENFVIWLRGFMSSGKSCLAYAVIEDQKRRQQLSAANISRLLYHYCDGTDAEMSKQISRSVFILRSLVKQFYSAAADGVLEGDIVRAYETQSDKSELTEEQCLTLLCSCPDTTCETRIVLDGLDECPFEVQRAMVKHLRSITENSKQSTKIFISSRDEAQIRDGLEGFANSIIEVAEFNGPPISIMIRERITEAMNDPVLRRLYVRGSESQETAVSDELEVNAQGMPRWVDLSFTFLHQSKTFLQMKSRVKQLADLKDLFDLYDKIYETNIASAENDDRIAVECVLQFLLYGFKSERDLYVPPDWKKIITVPRHPIDLILGACTFLRTRSLQRQYTANDILALCPGLLVVTHGTSEDSSELQIPHFSVKEYLMRKHSHLFSSAAGNASLASLCMEVLQEQSGELLPYYVQNINAFLVYAAHFWPHHMAALRSDFGTATDFTKYLQNNVRLRDVLRLFLLDMPASAAFLAWHRFIDAHKERAIVFSIRTATKRLLTKPPSTLFARLYIDYGWDVPSLSTDDVLVRSTEMPRESSMAFAVRLKQPRAIECLASKGVSAGDLDELGETPIFALFNRDLIDGAASHASNVEVIQALLAAGLDLGMPNRRGENFFHDAAFNGSLDSETIQFLRTYGFNIFAQDARGRTALEWAIVRHKEETWMLLAPLFVEQFPEIEKKNAFLRSAVHGQYQKAVEYLIAHGADPLHKDGDGRTVLENLLLARYHTGDATDLVEYLSPRTLGSVIDPNCGSYYGTALHLVAMCCSLAIVELWIKHGADPLRVDSKGYTALEAATSNANSGAEPEVIEFLTRLTGGRGVMGPNAPSTKSGYGSAGCMDGVVQRHSLRPIYETQEPSEQPH